MRIRALTIASGVAWALAATTFAAPAAAEGCPTGNFAGRPLEWSTADGAWLFPSRGPASGPVEWFTAPRVQPQRPGNPLSGVPWFVDCQWDEAWQATRIATDWSRTRRRIVRSVQSPDVAATVAATVARQPIARVFGPVKLADGVTSDPLGTVGMQPTVYRYLARTAQQAPGAMRFVEFRRLHMNSCHRVESTPPGSRLPIYRQLVDGFAAGVRQAADDGYDGPLTVIVEPDMMPMITCVRKVFRDRRQREAWTNERIASIRYAVNSFATLPATTVYLDAGASDWVGWKAQVGWLRKVGIAKIRGFALNVTHYDWTRDNVVYGQRLSKALGGAHFVVNTARAGGGNLPDRLTRSYDRGCNIPNAAVGPEPTVDVGFKVGALDAFLWLINPGLSDGNCRRGPDRLKTGSDMVWAQTLALERIRRRCLGTSPRCTGPRRVTIYE